MIRFIILFFTIFIIINAKIVNVSNVDIHIPYWEVTKGDKKFYLFGTMHLKDKRVDFIKDALKSFIKDVDGVYTEITLDPISKMILAKSIVSKEPLSKILPQDLQKDVNDYLKTISPMLNLKSFDTMKVWTLAATLPQLKDEIYNKNNSSLDQFIFTEAFLQKKEVGGIESLQEQIDIFDKLPLKTQIDFLRDTIDSLKKDPNGRMKIVNDYFNGDTKAILEYNQKLFRESRMKDKDKILDRVLYNRNIKMAKRVESKVNSDNKVYLFAFGELHFLGKKSVIEYLKKDGYKIKKKQFDIVKGSNTNTGKRDDKRE